DGPDNFDGMRAGTGSTAPTRRESETHHMWRPESLSTARILVPAEWHIRSPARSPLRATTAVAHLSSSRLRPCRSRELDPRFPPVRHRWAPPGPPSAPVPGTTLHD